MKNTIVISAAIAAASAVTACADRPPPREPTSTTASTTTTSYPKYQQSYGHANATSASAEAPPGEMATTGTASYEGTYPTSNEGSGVVHPHAPLVPPEPSLNERASARSTQAGKASAAGAKAGDAAGDGKSPNAAALTDQGNASSEVAISARIRRALVASDTLSLGAKNVKVITAGTKVTLRGEVETEAEKREIEGTARSTDGVTEVDNQLVVKK